MYRKQSKNCKGFTLLELLIALFIFTIIAIVVTHTLHNTLDIQEHTEKRAQNFADLQHSLLIISNDMSQIINRSAINFQDKEETPVVGTPTEVTFTHAGHDNPDGNLLQSTLQRVRYRVDKHNLLRETWNVLDQTPKSKPFKRILLTNVEAIHFDFLNAKKLFNEHWPEPNSSQQSPLPRAIRLTLTLKGYGKLEQTYLIPEQTNAPSK